MVGVKTHPVTGADLPICVCGLYFGTECRTAAIFGSQTIKLPVFVTGDPKMAAAAKPDSSAAHFLLK
jgi:hypothetical protein